MKAKKLAILLAMLLGTSLALAAKKTDPKKLKGCFDMCDSALDKCYLGCDGKHEDGSDDHTVCELECRAARHSCRADCYGGGVP